MTPLIKGGLKENEGKGVANKENNHEEGKGKKEKVHEEGTRAMK